MKREPRVHRVVIRRADLSEDELNLVTIIGSTYLKLIALGTVGIPMNPKYFSRITKMRGHPDRGYWSFTIVHP